MQIDIPADPRIKKYEKIVNMKDGKGAVVNIDPGTRVYREVGGFVWLHQWIIEVHRAFDGDVIPFDWVCDYVGVTRAALYKRVNRGGLTVLVYEMREYVKGILGGERQRMRREYKYVPRSECEKWRDIHEADEKESEKLP